MPPPPPSSWVGSPSPTAIGVAARQRARGRQFDKRVDSRQPRPLIAGWASSEFSDALPAAQGWASCSSSTRTTTRAASTPRSMVIARQRPSSDVRPRTVKVCGLTAANCSSDVLRRWRLLVVRQRLPSQWPSWPCAVALRKLVRHADARLHALAMHGAAGWWRRRAALARAFKRVRHPSLECAIVRIASAALSEHAALERALARWRSAAK